MTVGRLPSIDVQLEVGALTETIEVASAATMVDTTQSKVAVTVQQQVLRQPSQGALLPVADSLGSRRAPGTAAERQHYRKLRLASTGYQIDGASDGENVFLVDGVNTTNIQNGGVGKNFQMDFIEEVQVKTSSFEAEFGGALGGVINAVPKRGSNDWHGALLTYLHKQRVQRQQYCDRSLTHQPDPAVR